MKNWIVATLLIGIVSSCGTSIKVSEVIEEDVQVGQIEQDFKYTTISTELMDKNISIQDDFFSFCNGNWVANTQIPPSESRWGSFNELEKANVIKLWAILDEYSKVQGPKGSQSQILGNYFASYMNVAERDSKGFQPIKTDLEAIATIKRKDVLVEFIANQHKEGIGSAFSYGVGQDLKNTNRNITYMNQGGIGLPNKDYYLKENKKTILEAYQLHVQKCFEKTGIASEEAIIKAKNVVLFEIKLAEAMMAPAEMRDPEKTYNKYDYKQIVDVMGTFDFRQYLSILGANIPENIIVANPGYLKTFSELIESESLSTWKDYLTWNVINHYAGHLSQDFVDLNFDFYGKTLKGKKEQKPLHESAIDEITHQEFGELLGKAFVEKHFSPEAQTRVNAMVDNLFDAFKTRIGGLEWMTDSTKQAALVKLSSMGRKLGFPEKWEDYSSLSFSSTDYFLNVKEAARYSIKKNLDELYKPVDKDKWGMPAHMVNAYYHPLLNEIAFPAGIMQAPFFDVNAEDAVNYGRIGMVIGHEFTHGFDDMGSKFAADGSFTNWWSEKDRSAFEERTNLLGETFSSFCPMEGNCVNAALTMGENIADLGGLTLAFYAYKKTDEYKSEIKREGYSPAQRFFISYAQLWKIKYTDEELKNRLATDPHSPGMYRVNGPLKNCPEFFESFLIPEGKPMRNSKSKLAKIW